MLTSVISIPSAASWLLSLRQKAHQVVVYMVSGSATLVLPLATSKTTLLTSAVLAHFPARAADVGAMRKYVVMRQGPIAGRCERQPTGDGVHVPERRARPAADSVAGPWAVEGELADGPEAVLASLDPEQRQVALAARGPVCVLAGAGTGKTRAVAHRIAYLAAS